MKAKYLRGLLAVLLLLLPAAALADSITPSSYSTTLVNVGDKVTITKTVAVSSETPTTVPVDVFFLADETGSMGGNIAAVKASATTILNTSYGTSNIGWGVGGYQDVGDTFVYQRWTNITTDKTTAQSGINNWAARGGGDLPEANLYALQQVATTTAWRSGSERILVWFGDAPGHDPSLGSTEATATAALKAAGISVQAIDVGDLNSTGQAARIASATGGTYYSGINSSSIVAAIQAAISTAIEEYSTVELEVLGLPAGVGVDVSFDPLAYTGDYDRSIARDFLFDVTFTGLDAGVWGFEIVAKVDGAIVARESDSITVGAPAVPEPATLLLIGFGLLGLTGVQRRMKK